MKPFEDLLVIDLSHVWAGPTVTRILSDLGADVIKVERPTGPDRVRIAYASNNDTTGDYWNRSPYFNVRQAGKRGITVDFGTEAGKEIFHGLLKDADVLVESFTPRVMASFGFTYAELQQRYPRLIMLSICGYGQTGPHANRAAFGMGMEPASGIASVSGYEGGPPMKSGNTWTDPFSGVHATSALFAALYYRQRSGRGQHIDVAMQEGLAQLLGWYVADYTMNGRLHQGHGSRRPNQIRGIYPCAGEDAWLAISARDDAEWEALCRTTGHPEWLEDARFASFADRTEHHDEIDAALTEWTQTRDKMEAMDTLQRAGVPAGAVLNAREIMSNEQLIARHFFDPLEVQGFATIPIQRYFPTRIDGQGYGAARGAPGLGEHTDEVLREVLGYDDAKLAELREAGVTTGEPQNWISEEARQALIQPLELLEQSGAILGVDHEYRERIAETIEAIRAVPD